MVRADRIGTMGDGGLGNTGWYVFTIVEWGGVRRPLPSTPILFCGERDTKLDENEITNQTSLFLTGPGQEGGSLAVGEGVLWLGSNGGAEGAWREIAILGIAHWEMLAYFF